HVILAGRNPLEHRAPRLLQLSLDSVADDGPTELLRHGDPEPGLLAVLGAVEPVEHEEPRRHRAAVAIHGVEVPRARETMPTLHAGQADSRLRPRDRRRFRIIRPARVDMRARKPCLRFRLRTFGW